ncbi:MAG: hypothetical protein UT85_C0013G0013 [Candidatus Levybacteria bacterium GW2011_GWA2_40_16]|nr:MAG: hypothetical protein UT20_C0026G0014 [Candidatus Levybacteria bacterium GW2011_GWA1_39_11]KKR49668.1 MAG: hypothetical protein UT85_C0013G0013 [Candidatus Levybacteria bacterium GW2011_GWA2_40_16]
MLIPLFLYLLRPNQITDGKRPVLPAPTLPENPSPTLPQNQLRILRHSLPERKLGLYEGFVIEFSDTPSPSEFYYEAIPQTPINLSLEGTTILLSPKPTWNPDANYTIIIKKETQDTYGNFLDKDYVFKFKTVLTRGI